MKRLLALLLVSVFAVTISMAAGKQSEKDSPLVMDNDRSLHDRTHSALDDDCDCGTGDYSYCNNIGGTITDNGTTDFVINVPNGYYVTDLRVCWTITHTFDSDLSIYLVSPLGTVVELSSQNGGPGNDMVNTIMSDNGSVPITVGSPPFTGCYIPEEPLSTFRDENTLGDWILRVTDDVATDEGILEYACLTFIDPVICDCGQDDYSYCNNTGGTITDYGTTNFVINIPVEYSITDLRVCWTITHSFDSDLDIYLVSPLGTVVELSSDNGGTGDNMINTVMSDYGVLPITQGSPPFTGCFIPEEPLSAFIGENTLGNWILRITDDSGGDRGRLEHACLTFAGTMICHCGTGDNSHCNNTGGAITDNGTTDFVINVPNEYAITDLRVCWSITHTFDGDLSIYLVSPLGTVVELSTGNGNSGDNMINTIMSDNGFQPITAGSPPFTGCYIPEEPLSTFYGENALGDWRLRITDVALGDRGNLQYVCLTFEFDEILPVELTGFNAIAGNQSVTLNWSTASETDNDHFDILRNETIVGRVSATNDPTGNDYTWTENNLANGREYTYRLLSVDVNGMSEVIGTVSATPAFNSATVTEYALHQNYPNPFNPSTTITFDLVEAGHTKVIVYNTVGQTVAVLVDGALTAGRHTIDFNAAALPSGLYFYHMEAGDFSAVKKMVLMK